MKIGGPAGIRTPDPLIKSQLLYHLSYRPIAKGGGISEHPGFVESPLVRSVVGSVALLGLYAVMLIYGIAISLRARSHFGRLLGMGVTVTFFLYVFINMAMVMGVIPVVGVPLPLISYGGTAMLTLLFGFGLLMGVWVHRDVPIGRRGAADT